MIHEIKDWLEYVPETGIFIWKKDITVGYGTIKIEKGTKAGYQTKAGYVSIGFNKKYYQAHQLAWYFINGYFPKRIDHRNGIKNDNRISNLREATVSQNSCNRGISSRNKTGYKGVFKEKDGKFSAFIGLNNKPKYLERFKTREEAAKAYNEAAIKLHKNFAKINILV